jgi:thioredoxin 2
MTALLITCPHCLRRNRVPAERLRDGGHCGACKGSLFTGQPLNLSSAALDAHLAGELPLIVDFWADWCGPCKQFAPVFAQAARQLEPGVRLAKIDTEAEPALAQRFGIRSIPTLIAFRQGREVSRMAGALPLSAFLQWAQQATAGTA